MITFKPFDMSLQELWDFVNELELFAEWTDQQVKDYEYAQSLIQEKEFEHQSGVTSHE